MPTLDQIRESIEARIAELENEMTTLEAARSALHDRRGAVAPLRRRRPPRTTSNGLSADASAKTGNGSDAEAPVAADQASPSQDGTPPKPRRRSRAKRSKSEKPVEVLLAGTLEAILGEADGGLSAIAISRSSNAAYDQVLDLLRHLESVGQVRRTGSRRTSRWQLITDEERIAKRAAELERQSRLRTVA